MKDTDRPATRFRPAAVDPDNSNVPTGEYGRRLRAGSSWTLEQVTTGKWLGSMESMHVGDGRPDWSVCYGVLLCASAG